MFGPQSTVGGVCASPLKVDRDELISAVVAAAGAKTAVVAVSPGALLTPWADQAAGKHDRMQTSSLAGPCL